MDTLLTHIDKLVVIRSFNNHVRFKQHQGRLERNHKRALKTDLQNAQSVKVLELLGVEDFSALAEHLEDLRDEALEFEKELLADEQASG